MTKPFISLLLFLILMGCEKSTFSSKPTLKITSVSSTLVGRGSDLEIRMRLTDKEGDFLDTVWVRKVTTRCTSSNFIDSLLYRIPSTTPRTNNFDGDVVVTFSYPIELQPRCNRNDTAVFSFWLKDEKGNKSDTVRTQPIVILR